MARPRRNVPDDDLLAVRRGQNVLFGFREAGCLRRRAGGARNRKQERALHHEQHGERAGISDGNDDQEPFQGGHDAPRAGYIPLTMLSVTFLASPSSIMVLSR